MRLTMSGYSKDPTRAEAKQYDLKSVCIASVPFISYYRKLLDTVPRNLSPELEKKNWTCLDRCTS